MGLVPEVVPSVAAVRIGENRQYMYAQSAVHVTNEKTNDKLQQNEYQ